MSEKKRTIWTISAIIYERRLNIGKECSIILPTEDAALFYRLWLPLLDYVNQKYNVNPEIGQLSDADSIAPADVMRRLGTFVDAQPVICEINNSHRILPANFCRRCQSMQNR